MTQKTVIPKLILPSIAALHRIVKKPPFQCMKRSIDALFQAFSLGKAHQYCASSFHFLNIPILRVHLVKGEVFMRSLSRALFQTLFAVLCIFAVAAAHAGAPQVKTQVPGYYRHMLGSYEVTALFDGVIELDAKLLKNTTPAQVQTLLARMFRVNPTQTAVNAYLINTGNQLVLVDTGAAAAFGPSLGKIMDNLKAAGYAPEQIDHVLITHLHGDHVNGLIDAQGNAVFANATVHVAAKETAFWLNAGIMAKAPKDAQGFFKMAQAAVAPYQAAGKLKTFEGDAELLPGIKPVALYGHTPGHSGYAVASQGKSLLIWGDIVHNAAVQFANPKVTIEFDTDQKAAQATRARLLAQTAKDKTLVAGMHLAFPGIGHVRAEGAGKYEWVPIDFAPLPAK
jgi:glyoxylase-like metal-dependent hydrolase (beta-lactamase superfamily II)